MSLLPPAWTAPWTSAGIFAHDGTGPVAWNCFNLMAAVQRREFGLPVPLWTGAMPNPDEMGKRAYLEEVERLLADRRLWKRVERPEPGDSVVLQFGGLESHCGVVVGIRPRPADMPPAGLMMHVHMGINVTCEEWHGDKWRNRVVGFYQFVGSLGGDTPATPGEVGDDI